MVTHSGKGGWDINFSYRDSYIQLITGGFIIGEEEYIGLWWGFEAASVNTGGQRHAGTISVLLKGVSPEPVLGHGLWLVLSKYL